MRKSVLLVVGAALLFCLGVFALSGSRSASADTTPGSKPTVPATTPATAPASTAPPATTPATSPASTAPPATSPPATTHHKTKKTKTTHHQQHSEAPPPTEFQPSYTTYPYTNYGATTTSSTSTTSTTSTTIAGIESKVSSSPQTVPLATKASNGHVSNLFPILAYIGFGLAILIVLIRLFVTRPGGQDRRPLT